MKVTTYALSKSFVALEKLLLSKIRISSDINKQQNTLNVSCTLECSYLGKEIAPNT